MKERLPATFSVAIGGAFLYLSSASPSASPRPEDAGRRRQGAGVELPGRRSIPYYLFALLTWLYLTVIWEIPFFSDTGYFPITENPAKWFSGMFLAWMALGIFGCTPYTRYSRGSMVEVLSEDYIRTAKAKGLPPTAPWSTSTRLRAALVPVVTIFGIDFGTLLAGTIFTETIFDIDGHRLLGPAGGPVQRDLPVVPATALFAAAVLIISNIVVDIVYSILDPRG